MSTTGDQDLYGQIGKLKRRVKEAEAEAEMKRIETHHANAKRERAEAALADVKQERADAVAIYEAEVARWKGLLGGVLNTPAGYESKIAHDRARAALREEGQ